MGMFSGNLFVVVVGIVILIYVMFEVYVYVN